MSVLILHDQQQDIAVLYCNTDCRALNHQSFDGPDADLQADDFLEWLAEDPRTVADLDQMIGLWRAEAFNGDEFVGHRSKKGELYA